MIETTEIEKVQRKKFTGKPIKRQKTEDRRQKTEDRRQKTEDRRQKTETVSPAHSQRKPLTPLSVQYHN
ncbi:hypothetical protein GBN28_08685 [Plesiomonas shigelloides]|nr:hypothetical protein GBN28_08685 [Plesiomonas shigelloides]